MAELNEYECGMLDAILETFGISDTLSRQQLLDLFDQDEDTAFAMIQILEREQLVAERGKKSNHKLPQWLELKAKGEKYLKEGGFTRRYQIKQQKPATANSTMANLQEQNMLLQDKWTASKKELAEFERTIENLKMRQYVYWALLVIALIVGYLLGHHHQSSLYHE